MARKKHKPEVMVAKLLQVDALMARGRPAVEAVRPKGRTRAGPNELKCPCHALTVMNTRYAQCDNAFG